MVESYYLEPFKANFNQDQIMWSTVNMRMSSVALLIFVIMASMILLIACFNMTNTSIAITSKRLKEVGIRKVVGAAKWQITVQFLFETVLVICMALIVGLMMAQILVPAFADMWGLPYGMDDLNGLNLFITLLTLVFLASLLAGVYPAISKSKLKPVVLLKRGVKIKGTNFLTKSLITIQFAISVIVLIAGVIFIQNTKYQEEVDFGYDKEKVLLINVSSEKELEIMTNEADRNPKIQLMAGTANTLGRSSYIVPVGVDTAEYEMRHYGVGNHYLEVMGIEVSQGRTFNLENQTDLESAVVVNRAFLEKVGMKDPIGKIVKVHEVKRRIVGIVENHVENLFISKEPEPSVFYPANQDTYQYILIRANTDDLVTVRDFMEESWKTHFSEKPFNYQFQEDVLFQGIRQINANLKDIFLFLTLLGGLLSASGIFALASLNVEKRSKEIGIRKALGASVKHIVMLLNKEFVVVLVVAGIFGSLGGYFLTDTLLSQIYAYHINVGLLPVILCAMLILLIGLSTTSGTILRAAKANPVDTLKDE